MVLASMILQYLSGGASGQLAGKLQVWFRFGNSDFFLKVLLSLSGRYKIFSTDLFWIGASQNVILGKIDTSMTAINKKLWNR